MKKILGLLFVTGVLTAQAQQPPHNNEPALKVINAIATDSVHGKESPAYYLNGKLVHSSVLPALNQYGIDSITVEKGYREIEGKQYYGAIFVVLKKDYLPDLISLNEIKKQYTQLGNKTALFMVDGKAIQDDYDAYKVDKGYILSVTLEPIKNTKANLDLTLVKLLTKTPQNIQGAAEIRIRGNDQPLAGREE